MEDLILILDDEDIELSFEDDDAVFVDDDPHAHHYDEYSGDYEVLPSLDNDIELPTTGKLMIHDLVVKALPTDPAEAEITGTNVVTPMASVSGQNVTLGNTDTGISVTALGGGTASASVTATATEAGFVSEGTVLDTATLSSASATTSATSYIQSVVVPTSVNFTVGSESTLGYDSSKITLNVSANRTAEVNLAGNCSVKHTASTGSVSIRDINESGSHLITQDGKWIESEPTSSGTYYGKVIVSITNLLQEIYTVGSLYATETSTDDPATILGFGTWTKYAPKDLTWNDTEFDWADSVGVTDEVFVWKRTA